MRQLLIATHNPAKKEELKNGFAPLEKSGISLVCLDDLNVSKEPEETGNTFSENAQLKALYFSKLSHLPTVADDGGITIDILNGEPGVHSKRWLGRDASDDELTEYTLNKLRDVPDEKRACKLTLCLHYYNPFHNSHVEVTKSIDGHIAHHSSGLARPGFPYRALFIVDMFNKFYDELTQEEHNKVNHRLLAVKELIPLIANDLLQ